MNDNSTFDELLAAIVCGDRDETAPDIRALLAQNPELRRRLDELRAVQNGLAKVDAEAEAVIAEAVQTTTIADRQLVHATLPTAAGGQRLAAPWVVLAAALLLLGLYLAWPGTPSRDHGTLGDGGAVTISREQDGYLVRFGGSLPRQAVYHLELLVEGAAGQRSHRATTSDNPWHFPSDWVEQLAHSGSARLVVDIEDPTGTSSLATQVVPIVLR